MSNYSDYFKELSKSSDSNNNDLNYGSILNHKFNNNKRSYNYTHPNQLRKMTQHSSKTISDSKQDDLLGAIELLTYKPPPILPVSFYEKDQQLYYGSGKKKPFLIEEDEIIKPKIPIVPIAPIKPSIKPIVKPIIKPIVKPIIKPVVKPIIKQNDDLLNNLIKQGLAKIPVRNNKVPAFALKQDEIKRKTKALQERLNKPLVSKVRQQPIRLGFDVPDVGGSSTI